MTPRYIDANLAKAQFTGNFQGVYSPGEAKAMIDEVPTADVAPVIHAHWKEKGVWVPLARDASPWSYDEDRYDFETHSQKEFWWVCSNCDYKGDDWIKPEWIKYCPKCGAKMDEDVDK